MPSSRMLRRVALVKSDVLEERGASILHSDRRENPESYMALTGWVL
jgi:hypothetical protein